jgi:hypothetical protein
MGARYGWMVLWAMSAIWWIHFLVVFIHEWRKPENIRAERVASNLIVKCKDPVLVESDGLERNCAEAAEWMSTPWEWMDVGILLVWTSGCFAMIWCANHAGQADAEHTFLPTTTTGKLLISHHKTLVIGRAKVMTAAVVFIVSVLIRSHFGYQRKILQQTWDEQWEHVAWLDYFNIFHTSGWIHIVASLGFWFAIQHPERFCATLFTLANVMWILFKRGPVHEVQTIKKKQKEIAMQQREQVSQFTRGSFEPPPSAQKLQVQPAPNFYQGIPNLFDNVPNTLAQFGQQPA